MTCPPSHGQTWLLAVEKVSFTGHSRETWPPPVSCGEESGVELSWDVSEQRIHDMVGSFLIYSCLPLTIPGCLKGPCPVIMTNEVN